MKTFLILIFLLSAGFSVKAKRTMAERLGYAKTDKLLIIHADDIGVSHGANLASFGAMKSKLKALGGKPLVTSGSIMMPTPWVPEAIRWAKQFSQLDLGLHLTFTSEWKGVKWGPVAVRSQVPGLLNPDGFFWSNNSKVAKSASAKEVMTELKAQLRKSLAMGFQPTHLDTHMGTLAEKPQYIIEYYRFTYNYYKKTGIKYPPLAIRWTKDLKDRLEEVNVPWAGIQFFKGLSKWLEWKNFALIDYVILPIDEIKMAEHVCDKSTPKKECRKRRYRWILENLKAGVTQLMIHPHTDTADYWALVRGKHEAFRRPQDYNLFISEEFAEIIRDQNIKLISWKQMRQVAWEK